MRDLRHLTGPRHLQFSERPRERHRNISQRLRHFQRRQRQTAARLVQIRLAAQRLHQHGKAPEPVFLPQIDKREVLAPAQRLELRNEANAALSIAIRATGDADPNRP